MPNTLINVRLVLLAWLGCQMDLQVLVIRVVCMMEVVRLRPHHSVHWCHNWHCLYQPPELIVSHNHQAAKEKKIHKVWLCLCKQCFSFLANSQLRHWNGHYLLPCIYTQIKSSSTKVTKSKWIRELTKNAQKDVQTWAPSFCNMAYTPTEHLFVVS